MKNKLQTTPNVDIILFDYILIYNIIINLKTVISHSVICYYLLSGVLFVFLHMQVYKVSVQVNIFIFTSLFL